MKNLLKKLPITDYTQAPRAYWGRKLITGFSVFCLLFAVNSFATLTVSNTSSSASVTGSFAFAIQEINIHGSDDIEFDFHGDPGTHIINMTSLIASNNISSINGFGEDIALSGSLNVLGSAGLSALKTTATIYF